MSSKRRSVVEVSEAEEVRRRVAIVASELKRFTMAKLRADPRLSGYERWRVHYAFTGLRLAERIVHLGAGRWRWRPETWERDMSPLEKKWRAFRAGIVIDDESTRPIATT